MLFHSVAEAFQAIGAEQSRNKMTELLAHLLGEASAHEAQYICYLALGTLRAPYQGNQFNFAEKSMLKVLAQIYDQPLADYTAHVKRIGDLGTAVLQDPWPFSGRHLTVLEVYKRLEELMAISGTGSQEEKAAALTALLQEVDALSASFIIRIILGTMRLGFSDMTLIDALSWMIAGNKTLKGPIEHAYNLCADSGYIASLLKGKGIEAVEKLEPTLGIPIRPAAAERAESPRAIIERLGPCVAQPKLDGFRLQIHIDKTHDEPRIWFFSRNLQDMSAMFPDLVKALEHLKVQSLIVEGEAIGYDEETHSFLPFQETVKRKRKHDIEEIAESLPLRLFLFDILYINGKSVLSQTHEERRSQLEGLFKNYPSDVVQAIEERRCDTVQQLSDYFNEQITHGLEGLVVKRPDAAYQPGKRNFNWIKLKRHEEGHLNDTIDAVILGYYAGRGKRAAFGIGAFLVGVYDEKKDAFETVAKIGTGLTDEEWIDLKKLCDKQIVAEKPHNVICAPELYPDVWVNPATVVVVLADEITQSPLHTAGRTAEHSGFALRFPRFMGYSLDKSATQATSVNELKELFKLQYGQAAKSSG
jgi:DNA ligase 1